jgi:hypothetical protein
MHFIKEMLKLVYKIDKILAKIDHPTLEPISVSIPSHSATDEGDAEEALLSSTTSTDTEGGFQS